MSRRTSAKKRERTQNWLPKEKQTLLYLIKEHTPAILNKKIDAAALAMKNHAWCLIHNDFSGKFSTQRDIPKMKQQWRRMKAQARHEVYIHNDAVKKLGPHRAEKYVPSNLSLDVWKVMTKSRKFKSYSYVPNLHNAVSSSDSLSVNSSTLSMNSKSMALFNEVLQRNMATSTPLPTSAIKIEVDEDECKSIQTNEAEIFQTSDLDIEDIVISKFEFTETQNLRNNDDLTQENVDPFVDVVNPDNNVVQSENNDHQAEDNVHQSQDNVHQPRDNVHQPRDNDHQPRDNDHQPRDNVNQPGDNVHQSGNNVYQPVNYTHQLGNYSHQPVNYPHQLGNYAHLQVNHVHQMEYQRHMLKMHVLNTELELAELRKQAVMNELKTSEIKKQLAEKQAANYNNSHVRMSGEPGSGAGRGGGGGGSIREAGGSFGRMEAAHEDQYFYNLQKEQFKKLKEDLHDEISFHEEQIKRHQEAINRHKQRIANMK